MYHMIRFFKGIIVGIGGVAPGLSGSVLLIIFGLYQNTLDALGTLLAAPKKNASFLFPLVLGMFTGVLLFSRVIDYCLAYYEVPTRFCFLGLILGTLPMVWREVKKEGFSPKFYGVIAASAVIGTWLFTVNTDSFPQITEPTLLQCIALGVAVAATAIIPGVDPAVFLSTLGFYEMYVHALAVIELGVLLPMVIGLALGAMAISFIMSQLFKRFYTATYSVIFGIFLSMIPNMLTERCSLDFDLSGVISILLMSVGFLLSFYLGDLKNNNRRIKELIHKIKKG
ncbi:MAG: DUF368 domain-containing protein [Oscillospiraceae bacterium]|nr:DUF368 domain-containing protein [Oscillospiraceae bacterium]